MVDAWYMAVDPVGHEIIEVYGKHEVAHSSRYRKTDVYGVSPILTIWNEAAILIAQMNYMRIYYEKKRNPNGILTAITNNLDSLRATWKTLTGPGSELDNNPYHIPLLASEPGEHGVGKFEFIQMMNSPKDMELIAFRDDMRKRIAELYGLTPLYQGDVEGAGGLNNESQQLAVVADTIEANHKAYNLVHLPAITDAMGIEDYSLVMVPPRNRERISVDEEMERMTSATGWATQMFGMGFTPRFNPDNPKFFEFDQEPDRDVGGMPGMEGLFGEGGEGGEDGFNFAKAAPAGINVGASPALVQQYIGMIQDAAQGAATPEEMKARIAELREDMDAIVAQSLEDGVRNAHNVGMASGMKEGRKYELLKGMRAPKKKDEAG
jgi:hypothetical protein